MCNTCMQWLTHLYQHSDCTSKSTCKTFHTREYMENLEKQFQKKILINALMSASFWKRQQVQLIEGENKNLHILSKAHANFIIVNESRRINKTIMRSKRL